MTKSIAYGLLAMAVSASLALANGGEGDKKKDAYQGNGVSWKPGSGITFDGGDEFGLRLSNQLQSQWVYVGNESSALADTNNFMVRRARTSLDGHVFNRNIGFKLQVDAVDAGANIKDAWATYSFVNSDRARVGLRFGQGKTGFGLEGSGSSKYLFFVERSAATRTFADARTRGLWFFGSYMENKLRWDGGVMNGDVSKGIAVLDTGEEGSNADNELSYTLNVSFDPMGDTTGGKSNFGAQQGDLGDGTKDLVGTIGAGAFFGNNKTAPGSADTESTAFNINTAWRVSGFQAQGEVFIRNDDPQGGTEEDSIGWYAQAGYALPRSGDSPLQWGFGVRASMIDTDSTATYLATTLGSMAGGFGASGKVTEISAVVNAFYHGHAAKTQLEYTYQDVDNDTGTDWTNGILRMQFQLLF
ncbi:MAG: hypothetical protein Fur0037_10760 [Planctomycetota bacterium]